MGIDRGEVRQHRADHRFGTILPQLPAGGPRNPAGRNALWACAALSLAALSAQAQVVQITETISVLETYTNNVNLAPSGADKKGDLVSEITPGAIIDLKGAHATLRGTVAVPIVLYARTGGENNSVYVNGDLLGTFEAFERFFVLEAEVTASQQYFTPFGATPVGLTNATNNRYTSVTYRLSPYIQGVTGGNITYLLRLNSVWSDLYSAPLNAGGTNYIEWIGNLASPVAPWGWAVDFNRSDVRFNDQPPQIMQLVRLRLLYQLDPQLRVSGSFGYENNQFPFTDYSDVIYGVQAAWRPTERTNLVAGWEHRFFGPSYLVTFEHRTPQSVWNLNFTRNITTYSQQLASLPAGSNVSSLLNDLLTTRIPDPAQRQTAVNQLIADRGLPQVLGTAVNLYTQQVLLEENLSATIGLLGVNNSIFLTAYNLKNQPITGSGIVIPPVLSFGNNNTQRGVGIIWSHILSPHMSLVASGGASKTIANAGPSLSTENAFARVGVNWTLTPLTSVQFGARYQVQRADLQLGYNEAAVFAGFQHTFR